HPGALEEGELEARGVALELLELVHPLGDGELARVVLLEEVAVGAAEVALLGHVDRAESVLGEAEQEEAHLGEVVGGGQELAPARRGAVVEQEQRLGGHGGIRTPARRAAQVTRGTAGFVIAAPGCYEMLHEGLSRVPRAARLLRPARRAEARAGGVRQA